MLPRRSYGVIPVLALQALVLAGGGPAAAAKRTLCVHGLEPPASLKLHSGPGADSAVLGSLPAKACGITLAGRCEGHWCQMSLGRSFGWVDTRNIGVYEVPEGARAANARPAAKGAYTPPAEAGKQAAAPAPAAPPSGPPAGPPTAGTAQAVPPPVVVEGAGKAPEPPARARATIAKAPVPKAKARPRTRVAVRPAPRVMPRPIERPRLAERIDAPRSWGPPASPPFFGFGAPVSPTRSACVVDVARWDTLRIRSGPGVQHREIGEIPPGACGVAELGSCLGSWCRVAWRGQGGWVNTRYLD